MMWYQQSNKVAVRQWHKLHTRSVTSICLSYTVDLVQPLWWNQRGRCVWLEEHLQTCLLDSCWWRAPWFVCLYGWI